MALGGQLEKWDWVLLGLRHEDSSTESTPEALKDSGLKAVDAGSCKEPLSQFKAKSTTGGRRLSHEVLLRGKTQYDKGLVCPLHLTMSPIELFAGPKDCI